MINQTECSKNAQVSHILEESHPLAQMRYGRIARVDPLLSLGAAGIRVYLQSGKGAPVASWTAIAGDAAPVWADWYRVLSEATKDLTVIGTPVPTQDPERLPLWQPVKGTLRGN
jgi:hypothetical protein